MLIVEKKINICEGFKMKVIKSLFLCCLVFTLIACGGGGGTTTNADPQGYWTGPASTGYTVSAAILDSGESWGIYSSGSTIYGALYGTASASGNSVTIAVSDFDFTTNAVTAGTFTGTVAANSSMSLTGNTGVTASLTYESVYDTAATSAAIGGTWSFIGRAKSYLLTSGTITVGDAGNFTLNQTNCVTTGTVLPRSGGKNIYNLTLSAVGTGCAAGQSSMAGIVFLDTSVTPNKFLSLALTPSKNDGVIVIGTRQ